MNTLNDLMPLLFFLLAITSGIFSIIYVSHDLSQLSLMYLILAKLYSNE